MERKRRRTDTSYDKKQKRAIAINSKLRKAYPSKDYGIAYMRRGTAEGIARFGETYKSANEEQRAARKAVGYYGRGDYKALLRKWIPSGTFSSLGRDLGGMTGIPGMNAVGSYAGHKFSNLVGFGDYGPSANQLISGGGGITVNASDDKTGDIYLSHREYVGAVTTSAVIPAGASTGYSFFAQTKYELNPGLVRSFPWLAQIASNFTLYEWQGLIFEYIPTSGEFGTTGTNALGKVIMATQYDPQAPDWISSTEMQNYDYANVTKPSMGLLHGCETHPAQTATRMLYVRDGRVSRDKIFTDIGNFYVATEGIPLSGAAGSTVTANIGELWVTYRIKLSRAKLNDTLGNNILTDLFWGYSNSSTLGGGTGARLPSEPLVQRQFDANGAEFAIGKFNTLGARVVSDNLNGLAVQFPQTVTGGFFLIDVTIQSGSAVNTVINDIFGVNCSIVLKTNYGNAQTIAPSDGIMTPEGVSASQHRVSCVVEITAPGNSQAIVDIDYTVALPNPSATSVIVTQLNSELFRLMRSV